jgi:hypothetical protein
MDTEKLIASLEAAPGIIIGPALSLASSARCRPRTSSAALRRTSGPLTSMPATYLAATPHSWHAWN